MRVAGKHLIHRGSPACQSDEDDMVEETHVDDRVEVSETVTRELTKDGDHENLSHSPSTIVVVKQRSVYSSVEALKNDEGHTIPPGLVDTILSDTLSHFGDL